MKKNILITGVTGVLGSEILYGLLEDRILKGKDIDIFVLIRSKNNQPIYSRLEQILNQKCLTVKLKGYTTNELMEYITVVEGDCSNFSMDKGDKKFTIIHSAASVNLGNKEKVKNEIKENNFLATSNLIDYFGTSILKFIYISTAFSSGIRKDIVTDDYLNLDENNLKFRNHYENWKFKAEQMLVEKSIQLGFSYSIARPSVICGRMIREPHFYLKRYSVFYMIGRFIEEMKDDIEQLRIVASEEATLNIVPVDYVSAAVIQLIDIQLKQVNIVASEGVRVKNLLTYFFHKSDVNAYSFVSTPPNKMNKVETIYYKTIGAQFNYYLNTEKFEFDTKRIRGLLPSTYEPNVTSCINEAYDYAHSISFSN